MKKFILASLMLWVSAGIVAPGDARAQLTASGYTNHNIHGWNVLVNDQATANHPATSAAALAYIAERLKLIVDLHLYTDIMEDFRSVPIFMEWDKRPDGAAEYHPSRDWLIQNGYIPEKEKAIEISNMSNFLAWSDSNQPWMVLHELVHAYHDQVLGYGNADVFNAFQAAQSGQLYQNVLYLPGNGVTPWVVAVAYAMTNHNEYFAEITEAYLGFNDYFPFDRNDLEVYDPIGFALTASTWLQTEATYAESVQPEESILQSLYPNPTTGILRLEGLDRETLVHVSDVLGRLVLVSEHEMGMIELDLSGQPAGLYLVRVESAGSVQVRKVLKTN